MSLAADPLPEYDPLQTAFHRTFQTELYRAIDSLKLPRRCRALDAPCGNGFYARRLAEKLSPAGRLTLADASPDYLALARRTLASLPPGVAVEFRQADVYYLPFDDGTFDFVWCAQSLISLEHTHRALTELARVTRPGGRIAVLEMDEFHHVLLPWPVELELAIQTSIYHAARRRYGSGSRLAPVRHLRAKLTEAGWTPVRKLTFASDRQAPFQPWEAEFLARHLQFVAGLVRDHLTPADRDRFDRFADPHSPDSFLRSPDAELTCLNTIHLARKPK